PLRARGRELAGVLSWNLGDRCSYRCSYCTQRRKSKRDGTLEDVAGALRALEPLPGAWAIKLSGGEPFEQPALFELCAALVARGHVLSVQTNFAAPLQTYREFVALCGAQLEMLSLSLHLEKVQPVAFLEKLLLLRQELDPELGLHVTCVATPANLPRLRDELRPLFEAHAVVLKVQPEKVDGRVRPYDAQQRALLMELGGHNLSGEVEPCFRGRPCAAGMRYFIIKSDGRAFRCYPASRLGGRFAALGSLQEGIQLLPQVQLCPYAYCSCSVPRERGMVGRW
ncbi:MAG: hypothetical protein RBU37_17100, partial [Myxococcota bacterium]|nr:hypothetical protein [Myxococcota bacterium]